MTNNTDAKVAREWAEKISVREKITFSVDEETLAAARYILDVTAPPTMADVEWDNNVHSGLCAEHTKLGTVLMLSEWHGEIACFMEGAATLWLAPKCLTPIQGTKIDLTPRSEPESTPEHPTELTTEAEYRNAPEGTIVAAEDMEAWTKGEDGSWETWGIISGYNNYVMADGPRRVLRWGWEA